METPLINPTKRGKTWNWGPEQENAIQRLKEVFASESTLAQWDPEKDTVLEADYSGYALGGCLSKKDDLGKLRTIAYFSRRLNSAQANYPIHDKEMHAIVACLKNERRN
ncbi:hypothetical protein K3495_g5129 [Podosphaera aphanis]|nr:hypothetical protein K3495_g5129 [Podosphaera aphanis]